MSGHAYAVVEQHETESPFLGTPPPAAAEADETPAPVGAADESPFVSAESLPAVGTHHADDLNQLLGELYEVEFDRTLRELADTAAVSASESPFTQGEASSEQTERYVREWLEPLHEQAHTMLEAIGASLEGRDVAGMTEQELDELFAEHEPLATGANPVFEGFLGGLWKKVKHAVSGAVNLAKKGVAAVGKLIPIGPLLNRLKALVKPLLERVLQMALNRLPPSLRPAAEMLRHRLFGDDRPQDPPAASGSAPTTAPVTELQREFDTNTASLLFAADEAERDGVVAEAYAAAGRQSDAINELADARERLESELRALPPDGDPQPAVENFIPAVMAVLPLVRMGISLIGRDRVVRFLARFVSDLIKPYVGVMAPTLAQSIASTGLGMLSLEAPVDPRAASATVLAGTVEDTVRRVAEQADETLEQPDLLEATVASAFDEAASAHFPPALIKRDHRPVHFGPSHGHLAVHDMSHHHHDHRSLDGHHERHHPSSGMWIRLPRRHLYRRYTRVLTAHVTPTMARQIQVFGGGTLEAFLRDRYGITGEVTAPVHIYEALPGATLGRIAAAEAHVHGLGHARAAWKLQPLTPEVAGMLLGEPGLGRAASPEHLAKPEHISVGQRFYYLELRRSRSSAAPGSATPPAPAEPPTAATSVVAPPAVAISTASSPTAAAPRPAEAAEELEGSAGRGRSSEVNVRVEPHRDRIRVALYLSEADAQEAAAMIRAHGPAAATKLLHQRLKHGLRLALSGDPRGHLHWIERAQGINDVIHPHPSRPALLSHPEHAAEVARRVVAWSARAMVSHITHDHRSFLAAVDRRSDGVTVVIHLHGARLSALPSHGEMEPTAVVRVLSGFHGA